MENVTNEIHVVLKICVLLCIINRMGVHAIGPYLGTRQNESCDWPQEYISSAHCSCIKQTMSCVYDIPKIVPMRITTVTVRKYLGHDYPQTLFSDESWGDVDELAIDTVEDMYFHDNSFIGLSKLQTLTLTGMGHLISFGDIFLLNDSVPYLKELTVNPGPQQGKPEILLNEESFTGLLKRPLKQLNFSNVLLVTVEDKLVELSLILKVLNLSDTTVVAYPPSHRTETKSQNGQKGRAHQATDNILNQTRQQGNYFNSYGRRLTEGFVSEINRKTMDNVEANSELKDDSTSTHFIKKAFNLKTNMLKGTRLKNEHLRQKRKQYVYDVDIHSKRMTNIGKLHQRFISGLSGARTKEGTGSTLQSLDISGAEVSWGPMSKDVLSKHGDDSNFKTRLFAPLPVNFLLSVENVFFNRLSKEDINITKSWNLTGTPIYIKTMSGRNNGAVALNVTLTLDENNPVVSMDFAYNKLQYIAKTAFWCLTNLKRLNLSWNKLYKMERDSEFGQLFINLKNLNYLNLAHNSISYLQSNMVQWNRHLEELLLNDNELTTFGVDLYGLDSLQKLDLSNNKIKYFSDVQVNKLSSYFDTRILQNKTNIFHLLLQGNLLQCVCKSKAFLKTILHYKKVFYSKDSNPPKCSYQGDEIVINKDALDKADYLCKRVKIILTATVATSVISVTVGVLVAVLCRRHKRRRKQDLLGLFVSEFLSGNVSETHLAFIAMSGNEDDRGLMQTVVTHLHTLAKQYLNTQKQLILTGYDFTPGFPIVSEAYRMIKACCVVVAFVSKSFCQSKYCMMELQEACNQDKPLILIFTEHIDENLMTPYMLEVFKRCARGRLEQTVDGEWIMRPSIDKLCEAMIVLASQQRKRTYT